MPRNQEHAALVALLKERIAYHWRIVADNPYTTGNDGLRDKHEQIAEALEGELKSLASASPVAGEAQPNLTGMPFCRKHRIYKKAVAHYFCEECAALGEATVGPASAHHLRPAPAAVPEPVPLGNHPLGNHEPCAPEPWVSRVCERGTRCCPVHHGKQPAAVREPHTCMGGDLGSSLNGPCRACEVEKGEPEPSEALCQCGHPESDHETVEYRGTDKPRSCVKNRQHAPKCPCMRFAPARPTPAPSLDVEQIARDTTDAICGLQSGLRRPFHERVSSIILAALRRVQSQEGQK